jgi:hypothetical protein
VTIHGHDHLGREAVPGERRPRRRKTRRPNDRLHQSSLP